MTNILLLYDTQEKELGSRDISRGNFLCNVRNNVPEVILT
jgi:hypothetical protein